MKRRLQVQVVGTSKKKRLCDGYDNPSRHQPVPMPPSLEDSAVPSKVPCITHVVCSLARSMICGRTGWSGRSGLMPQRPILGSHSVLFRYWRGFSARRTFVRAPDYRYLSRRRRWGIDLTSMTCVTTMSRNIRTTLNVSEFHSRQH